ncbi:MAG TPA: hypothetical protein VD967_00085 [Candidatus Paceibacterota bacterium]|nr:hypothetical protein [Candidatus Paceibacterota bacterium]
MPLMLQVGRIRCPQLQEFSSVRSFWKDLGAPCMPEGALLIPEAGMNGAFTPLEIRVFELQESPPVREIHPGNIVRMGFVHIRFVLDLQREGDPQVAGLDLADGYPNVFFVADMGKELWRIEVAWKPSLNQWEFSPTIPMYDTIQTAGSRVFL